MARRALPGELRLSAASALLVVLLGAATQGCDGAFVNLGASGDELRGGVAAGGSATTGGAGGEPEWRTATQPLLPQVLGFGFSNPTLTADQQQLYYTEQELGADPDPHPVVVMHAARSGDGFGAGMELKLTADTFGVAGPAISADGSELWFSRLTDSGDSDIWRSRAQGDGWTTPERLAELSSPFDDVARPTAVNGSLMPLSSKRHGGLLYQIYLATRGSDGVWGVPSQEHLGRINSADYLSADGFLSADGLSLYFASSRNGDADLYVARRSTLDADFGEPRALDGVNSPFEERQPWVSADEQTLYFASNRPGEYEQYGLYVASRRAP